MYNVGRHPILNYMSNIYIAKKLDSEYDDNGNELPRFDTPIKYRFNVQANKDSSYISEPGYVDSSTKVILITNKAKYLDRFKEFDKVYIETTPKDEFENGDNADYRILAVRNQNTCIKLYITKLVQDDRS